MNVKGLGWLGTRTDKFDEMVRLYEEIMGLQAVYKGPDLAAFKLANGDEVEVIGPSRQEFSHFTTGPVAEFLVDDVQQARTQMEAAGVEFIGPIQSQDNFTWTHFRGPDGNVYGLTSRPS